MQVNTQLPDNYTPGTAFPITTVTTAARGTTYTVDFTSGDSFTLEGIRYLRLAYQPSEPLPPNELGVVGLYIDLPQPPAVNFTQRLIIYNLAEKFTGNTIIVRPPNGVELFIKNSPPFDGVSDIRRMVYPKTVKTVYNVKGNWDIM